MAIKAEISGMPGLARRGITGTVTGGLTAAGNSQATALAIRDVHNVVTTVALNTGVILRADLDSGDSQYVANLGANALSVYPALAGQINLLGVNNAFSVPVGKTARFICTQNGTVPTYIVILSA